MNDLKNKYSFLSDFFLPENDKFKIKKIDFNNIKTLIRFYDYYIYPISYKGFFNATSFLLLNKEIFLLENKDDVIKEINDILTNGLVNLNQINFKELKVIINQYVDEFNIKEEYLFIETELNSKLLNFIIPYQFLYFFSSNFFVEYKAIKNDTIEKILDYIKFRLYRDGAAALWDLKNFIAQLNNKNLQNLINKLLKNKLVEETMLTGFIAGFYGSATQEKIFQNLSKYMQQEVIKNIDYYKSDKRWVEQCFYLITNAIEKLILQNEFIFENLHYIYDLKEKLKEELYQKIFKNKPFENWLIEAEQKQIIEKIKLLVPNKIILISLKGLQEKYLFFFFKNLSQKTIGTFKDDYYHYSRESSNLEVNKARIFILDKIKNIYYSDKAKELSVFSDKIKNLNKINLNLLIEEVGILKFAQASIKENKEFKKHILYLLNGIVKNLAIDIYSGKVRFKQSFGDQTINLAKREILEMYYYLLGEEKFAK